ncbi:MAG: glycosyltransferase family 2 protein [Alphaproteobacteria bacterium]|nr:glycosyltransferase family 2 protein [Alphaproteobacteria bacterium]
MDKVNPPRDTDRPAVSVIIPVFNRGAEVTAAIESVVAQTFVDFEIVVVDDASTDDTVATVEAHSDSRIRVARNAVNRGPGGARNAGVAAARADIVAFLDSDDWWRPEKLERQLSFMAEHGTDVCCTGFDLIRPGRPGTERRLPDPPRLGPADMVERGDICIGTTMAVRRDTFDRVGPFDERLRRLEDWDWLLRLGRHRALDFVPESLAVHLAPAARDAAGVTRAAATLILDKHSENLARIDPGLPRRLKAMTARHVAAADWISGRPVAALISGLRALSLAPASGLRFVARRFWPR